MIRSPKYTMSPKQAGGTIESHGIPRRLREKPIKQLESIEGVSNALKIKASKSAKFDPSGFGKKIGSGAYGTVYLVGVSPAFKEYVKKNFNSGGTKIFASFPNVGSDVIVKLQKQNPQMSDDAFFEDVARENTVHKNLTTSASCYKIPLASRPTCITSFVPKFYLSWTFSSNGTNFCATIMDSAGDESIQTFAKSIKHISPEMYARFYVSFEQAICSLWLAGYVHGDLHRENVIINRKTGAAKLIDFGFALKLPQEFVKRIAEETSKMISEGSNRSFADIWTEQTINGQQTLVDYTNRIMSGKHYSWYNPDYKILQTVYNEIPRGGKALISSLRSRSWGIVRARKIAPARPAIAPARPAIAPARPAIAPARPAIAPKKVVAPTKKKTPWKPKNGRYWADETPPSPTKPAIAPARPAIAPKKVVAPTKKKTPWKPKNGRYWADETPPSPIVSSPVKDATPSAIAKTFDKVNAKGRKVFKDDKGRTYVKQGDKKVYVKKLFTPKADTPVVVVAASPATNVGKVNAKKRKVFKNSKGRTYVKQGDKKVYVKKLFTPKADTPVIIASPIADTGKVNAKKRKVFVDTKKRTYVKQGDKKVYVRKLFTPKST
ncbi:PBCV-specific basic adaptor domain-containing protein [Paramecium bursaria Chlorella virus NE-JV-1]|nr:PBCV-specific basic adaptor domain-containing protein [Paramecium bursaria Chlorella virus NE-JV-1]